MLLDVSAVSGTSTMTQQTLSPRGETYVRAAAHIGVERACLHVHIVLFVLETKHSRYSVWATVLKSYWHRVKVMECRYDVKCGTLFPASSADISRLYGQLWQQFLGGAVGSYG